MRRTVCQCIVLGLFGLGLVGIANCGSEQAELGKGARCSLNSDCAQPLVCGFERCRSECQTSRDCDGKLCVRGNLGGNVCQLDDEVECTHNSQCPGTQLCASDRRCRDVCITDKDCVTNLLCVTRVCAKPEELVAGALPERLPAAGARCTYATDCPNDLVCLYGKCDVECLGAKDCLVGWSCKPQSAGGDGRCYPNSSTDASVVDAVSSDAASDVTDVGPKGDADADATSDAGGGTLARRVAVGSLHACALLPAGKVKCWGAGGLGQLGYGDTTNRGDDPGEMGDNLPFVDFGTGLSAVSVTAGGFVTCVVLTDGRAKCWGYNTDGQLGAGDTATRGSGPNQMGNNLPFLDLGAGRTVRHIEVGDVAACAILDNNGLKCWGDNNEGRLGYGDTARRGDQPSEMGDNLPFVNLGTGRTVKSVTLGDRFACAILDNDRLKCWGRNTWGQLGLGDTNSRGDQPNEMGDALPYVDVGTGRTVKAVGATAVNVCALLDNNSIRCWGYAGVFGLGYGDSVDRGGAPNEMGDNLPIVDMGPGRVPQTLFAGYGYNVCMLGNVFKCWGLNSAGVLGVGDTVVRGNMPGQMGSNLPEINLGAGRSAVEARTSGDRTCALLDNGAVKCWGNNFQGGLGLGDTTHRGDLPNQMGDNLPVVKLTGP